MTGGNGRELHPNRAALGRRWPKPMGLERPQAPWREASGALTGWEWAKPIAGPFRLE